MVVVGKDERGLLVVPEGFFLVSDTLPRTKTAGFIDSVTPLMLCINVAVQ